MRKDHPLENRPLTLRRYLGLKHIAVQTDSSGQTLVDRSFAEQGVRRNIVASLPYFLPCLEIVPKTDLVLTCPERFATRFLQKEKLRYLPAPEQLPKVHYSIAWHQRSEKEALRQWAREQIVTAIKGA